MEEHPRNSDLRSLNDSKMISPVQRKSSRQSTLSPTGRDSSAGYDLACRTISAISRTFMAGSPREEKGSTENLPLPNRLVKRQMTMKEAMIANHTVPFGRSFNYNIAGIIGTEKDKAFYRVNAMVAGETTKMPDTDWTKSNTKEYYLKEEEDKTVFTDDFSFNQYSQIIYQVAKFDTVEKTWDETYAFAVCPLTELNDSGALVLIQGQF